jgi:hypothetical protein
VYERFLETDSKSKTARDFKISTTAVRKIVKKFKEFGTFDNLPKKPLSRCTDRHTDLRILREISNSPKKPRDIKANLELKCSSDTIRRRNKSRGLFPRMAARVPFIDKRNQKKRMVWAKDMISRPK